jgi:hypothetical protein
VADRTEWCPKCQKMTVWESVKGNRYIEKHRCQECGYIQWWVNAPEFEQADDDMLEDE